MLFSYHGSLHGTARYYMVTSSFQMSNKLIDFGSWGIYMAYLYSDALDKLLSCCFVLKEHFSCVLKVFGTLQGGALL